MTVKKSAKKKAAKPGERAVLFLGNVEVKNHLGEVTFKAKEGETHYLNESSAFRWIRRGRAEYADK